MINKFNQFTSCPLMNMHNIFRYSGVKLSEPESLSSHIVEVQMMGYMILDHLNHTYNEGLDYGLYLEKAFHHDLEESLTGDVSRPLKYHNPKVLKELQDVAEHTARELYTKYFDNYDRMIQLWDNAKHGKEGILVKIVDMLVVASKALREVELLNNNYFLKVVYEVSHYLEGTIDYVTKNSPYNEGSTKYLLDLMNDALNQVKTLWENKKDLAESYRILDNTLMENDNN